MYNSAITLCARLEQPKMAADLVTEMLSIGLVPDAVTFSATIAACCSQDGDWRRAMQILDDARSGGNSGRYIRMCTVFSRFRPPFMSKKNFRRTYSCIVSPV